MEWLPGTLGAVLCTLLLEDSSRVYCEFVGTRVCRRRLVKSSGYCVLGTEMCRNCEVKDISERLLETVLGVCVKYQFLMQEVGQPTDMTPRENKLILRHGHRVQRGRL
jgi:hypothetical protein